MIEEIVEEMKERDRGERKMNESEETKEIKNIPTLPLPAARIADLAQLYANISWIRYMTPLPHPITPKPKHKIRHKVREITGKLGRVPILVCYKAVTII